jgi:UDP-N-acetylmuramate dehydrogenase
MEIVTNKNLAGYNTFNLNIKSDYFAEAGSIEDLIFLRDFIETKKLHYLVLGGGSNILFGSDYKGIVIRYIKDAIKVVDENENNVTIEADAGTNWDSFVDYCVKNNWYGAENLSLIPGNVGASPIQNIGAYGAELKDIFYNLEHFNFEKNRIDYYNLKDCKFGYRTSIFKNELKNKGIITKVVFKLSKEKKLNLSYAALSNYLKDKKDIDIQTVRNAVISIRESKIPDYKIYGNAGSFFKNPEIDEDKFLEISEKYPHISYFKVGENRYKIAAGWLIEQCGFKGKRAGNVGCYEKQALILINYGNATGKEIIDFSEEIINKVYLTFNIKLEREVNII